MYSFIAWLYWNPPKNVFTIPYLDRPIAWYGLLFVTGFILGYFVLIPILSRFLRQSKTINPIDVCNWPLLVQQLAHAQPSQSQIVNAIFKNLDSTQRSKIQSEKLDPSLKQEILKAINSYWNSHELTREEIEKAFPGAITPVSQISHFLADRVIWFIVAGTLIGARLGDVFFYDWGYYKNHLMEIFKVWNGGLASHGGTIGVFISLYLYLLYVKKWIPTFTFLTVLDCVVIPTPLACVFIRLGNFVNQEILGTPTELPWAVIFGHPVDGIPGVPRHPVQLYEALSLLVTFIILYTIWKKNWAKIGSGFFAGLMFVLIFLSRFILEFWKETQESILDSSMIQMGQLLSLPFVALGLFLIWCSLKKKHLYFDRHKQVIKIKTNDS
ncbi:MAG: prolipoprotein diacylglyceryl transferase [Parachlamydiaceae bacterium]|nr:prolipoprotein diacylglyceryl transferase [Parachlamydiaceae bacterium]